MKGKVGVKTGKEVLVKRHFVEEDAYGATWEIGELGKK